MLEYTKQEKFVVVAFWDGKLYGTKNMIDISKKAGAEIFIVQYK